MPDSGPGDSGADCSVSLTATDFVISCPGGFVDEVVTQAPGKLVYPCAGGRASAFFGTHEFAGNVTQDEVDVCLRTDFDYDDGCHWLAAHRITGVLATGTLDYRYDESPAPGRLDCLPPCFATAKLIVGP